MTMTNQLSGKTMAALNQIGCLVWRNNAGVVKVENRWGQSNYMHLAPKGSADIVGLTPYGRFIGIEIKAGDDRLSKSQERWRDYVLSKGGLYFVVKNVRFVEKEIIPHILKEEAGITNPLPKQEKDATIEIKRISKEGGN